MARILCKQLFSMAKEPSKVQLGGHVNLFMSNFFALVRSACRTDRQTDIQTHMYIA